jgi:hypothetical protein
VSEPNAFEAEMAIGKINHSVTDQITAEFIQLGGDT